jgi:transcriptional regulator with XRE-family HTH domain
MCDNVDEYIGRRLLCRRRALGLTQEQLGAAIGVRLQQIQRYECAANKVSASRLWQLAKALGVPITYFFEDLSDTESLEEDGRPRRAA